MNGFPSREVRDALQASDCFDIDQRIAIHNALVAIYFAARDDAIKEMKELEHES